MQRTVLAAATAEDTGREALALAVELARPIGARVVLGGVVPERHGRITHGHPGPNELKAHLNNLRRGAPADIHVDVEVTSAPGVLEGLNDLAIAHDASCLVLGPTHRGALQRTFRGTVATDAVFAAPCAVAVALPGQSATTPRRIGVAWNETPEADEALEWSVQLAERTGATLVILRILEPAHREGTVPEAGAEERLDDVRTAASQRASTEARAIWGDAAPALIEEGRNLDLLVLGSRSEGPIRRTIFGSVSASVLHHAKCPVVVLPRGVHAPLDTAAV